MTFAPPKSKVTLPAGGGASGQAGEWTRVHLKTIRDVGRRFVLYSFTHARRRDSTRRYTNRASHRTSHRGQCLRATEAALLFRVVSQRLPH